MDKLYNVMFYNPADADFGYDPGPVTVVKKVDLATAKSIVRHHTKKAKRYLCYYWYESTDGTFNSQYETMCRFYEANKIKEGWNDSSN